MREVRALLLIVLVGVVVTMLVAHRPDPSSRNPGTPIPPATRTAKWLTLTPLADPSPSPSSTIVPSDTPTVTVTATATATATPTPTLTPLPPTQTQTQVITTSTLVVPTETEVPPTETPEPEPKATPTPQTLLPETGGFRVSGDLLWVLAIGVLLVMLGIGLRGNHAD